MINNYDLQLVFQVLKKVMKDRGYNYKKLAQKLKVSEAAIKKIFYTEKLHLDRLAEICSIVQISMSQLFVLVEQQKNIEFQFTIEEEKFFVDHPNHYSFFREIFFHYKTLKQIKGEHDLTDYSVQKYLRDLEKLGVLEVFPNDEIKFKYYGRLKWRERGPWMEKNYFSFTNEISKEIMGTLHSQYDQASFGFCGLTEKSVQSFIDEISAIESKYRDVGYIEYLSTKPDERKPLTWNFQFVQREIHSHSPKIENYKK